jgi:hypothetical protein
MTKDDGIIDLELVGRADAADRRERAEQEGLTKVDGRYRRHRKSRTAVMTFRFAPEIRETIIRLAEAEDVSFVEIVEEAVRLLDQRNRGAKND